MTRITCAALPNPSRKPSPNGKPPTSVFGAPPSPQPGLGGFPSAQDWLER